MRKLTLIVILIIAFVLRFYNLGNYPALNADEAAIGYNAYSLLQTGKDEHGNFWPIHFQSFNDYKPGLYFYLVLPFVYFIGLSEWAVRIPGALLGVSTVLLIYLLIFELFKKNQSPITNHQSLALISALMLAISPWHLHFSRGGWEVNAATFLIVLGILFFLKGLKRNVFLFFSFFVLALSLYTYHAGRIIVPLLGLGLVIIYRNELFKREKIKPLVLNSIFLILVLLPLAKELLGPAGVSRAAGVGLFADPGPVSRVDEQRGHHEDPFGPTAKILHNKVINYGLAFLDNWSRHYHGEFLFLSGDIIQRNRVPETGQMYMFDAVLLLFGMWWMVRNSKFKGTKVVILWLIIAPVAAALTFQSPHALRAQNMVIPLVIISALGISVVLNWLNRQRRFLLIIGYWLLIIAIVWSFARYAHMYWLHMSKEYPFSSQYGVKELVSFIESTENSYDRIFITDRYDQPYILFLFYLKYPPQKFQQEGILTPRDEYGFSTVRNFDKYNFISIEYGELVVEYPNSLIVGTPEEIPIEANVIKEIYGTNGYKYFEIVGT